MEIRDASSLSERAESLGRGAQVTQLYPTGPAAPGLLAVDLWEIAPGGATSPQVHAEEHVLFVISGEGELTGESAGGVAARIRKDSVIYVGPREAHTLRNTGKEPMRVLVSTPLLVRSERALGLKVGQPDGASREWAVSAPGPKAEAASKPAELREVGPVEEMRPAEAQVVEAEQDEAEPLPDISGLMKRGSDLVGAPKTERRRAAPPPPEPETQPEESEAEGEATEEAAGESESALMELSVVFDGGSRGNPGQGYGSYMVQAPGRRPVIRRVELGDNYTNNQAEYDTLIASLEYIIERLTATGRTPQHVALDIKSDSDLLVNQINGQYKVKDAGIRKRHEKALSLLEQFGAWMLNWHARDESVRLLGH